MTALTDLPSAFTPFAPGDVFVAVTNLDNPDDDHAGRGRIIQCSAGLEPKAALQLPLTTHLVGGLKFDPQGRLWAFDSQASIVLVIEESGRIERRDFGGRSFSHVNFASDGSALFGEHLVGGTIRPEVAARMRTKLPYMPGTDRFGDGHVFRYDAAGRLLQEYATQTHGGMGGFLGVTMSALSPDEHTLVYCSETGPRLMRYDLAGDVQLPDLQCFPEGQREMFFAMAFAGDGTLYVLRGARIDVVSEAGITTRSIPLEGFGWALLALTDDGRDVITGNFFTGEVARIDLESGHKRASLQAAAARALGGIAVRSALPTAPRMR